jgi:hypothetical protein
MPLGIVTDISNKESGRSPFWLDTRLCSNIIDHPSCFKVKITLIHKDKRGAVVRWCEPIL